MAPKLLCKANQQKMTPLMCAVAGKHVNIVRLVLRQVARRIGHGSHAARALDAQDANGRTALHFAATGSGACVPSYMRATLHSCFAVGCDPHPAGSNPNPDPVQS